MNHDKKTYFGIAKGFALPNVQSLPKDAVSIVQNLQPPGFNAKPLSLKSMFLSLNLLLRKLSLDFDANFDRDMIKKVRNVSYHKNNS